MRAVRTTMLGNVHLDVYEGDTRVARVIYRETDTGVVVSFLHVTDGTLSESMVRAQSLIDTLREELADNLDGALSYTLTDDGEFTCGHVRGNVGAEKVPFIRRVARETKRRKAAGVPSLPTDQGAP